MFRQDYVHTVQYILIFRRGKAKNRHHNKGPTKRRTLGQLYGAREKRNMEKLFCVAIIKSQGFRQQLLADLWQE